MDNITKEYALLFNGITSIISELQGITVRLASLQQQAEQLYLDRTSENEPENPSTID